MAMSVMAITSFAQGKSAKSPEDRAKRRADAVQRVTGISDEQKGKVYNLIVEKQKAAKDVLAKNNNDKNASKAELKKIWDDYRAQFKSTLSAEQYQKWTDHLKEKRGKKQHSKEGGKETGKVNEDGLDELED